MFKQLKLLDFILLLILIIIVITFSGCGFTGKMEQTGGTIDNCMGRCPDA